VVRHRRPPGADAPPWSEQGRGGRRQKGRRERKRKVNCCLTEEKLPNFEQNSKNSQHKSCREFKTLLFQAKFQLDYSLEVILDSLEFELLVNSCSNFKFWSKFLNPFF
jgi:hypothetical protein